MELPHHPFREGGGQGPACPGSVLPLVPWHPWGNPPSSVLRVHSPAFSAQGLRVPAVLLTSLLPSCHAVGWNSVLQQVSTAALTQGQTRSKALGPTVNVQGCIYWRRRIHKQENPRVQGTWELQKARRQVGGAVLGGEVREVLPGERIRNADLDEVREGERHLA